MRTSTRARARAQPIGHARGQAAAALDEVGHAVPAEAAQRRVDGEAARAPRELGYPVLRVALGAPWTGSGRRPRNVIDARCAARDRARSRRRSRRARSATCGASVAHESARSTPADEMAARGRGARPQAEGAVDVHPGAALVRRRRRSRRSGSKAPVFTLPACAHTIVGPVAATPACGAGRRRACGPAPSARHAHARRGCRGRAARSDVRIVTCASSPTHDVQARRAAQPVLLDVPARALPARRAGRGERR